MITSILEQSIILGVMILGVYITYKILNFPDLSTDGTFALGGSIVGILLINGTNPFLATAISGLGGAIAGAVAGILHTKLKITNLLSGILVMTGLYSVNLRIMKKSNIHFFTIEHIFSFSENEYFNLIFLISFIIILILLLTFFFKTKFGFLLRALGDNETLITSLGINEENLKIIGLALGNSLIAISGALFAQYQGFSDVGMGIGIIVIALASIIIGELVCGKFTIFSSFTTPVIGAVLYQFIIVASLNAGLQSSDLKLLTSLIIISIIFSKNKINKLKKGRTNA